MQLTLDAKHVNLNTNYELLFALIEWAWDRTSVIDASV
jgi:hypothetical protein